MSCIHDKGDRWYRKTNSFNEAFCLKGINFKSCPFCDEDSDVEKESKVMRELREANKFCEIFKKSQIEFENRIEDLETKLDIALKSAELWKKEALKMNNIEPPKIQVNSESLTREMRFNLCLKMIDQMNQIELEKLISALSPESKEGGV